MRTIHYYPVQPGMNKIELPEYFEYMWLQLVGNQIRVYAIVETISNMKTENIYLAPTGGELPNECKAETYIGSVTTPDAYVWHGFLIS